MGSIKTHDIPPELREWWKFFQVVGYRHDYSRVFDDFLTMTLAQFGPPGMFDEWHATAMKPYDRKEKDAFNGMYYELFKVFDGRIQTEGHSYYDMFGRMYETLAGNYKRSGLGQFFTPAPVVEVLVDMTMPDIETGAGKSVVDPTCGSGRMLIIAHVKAPGNFQYGIDIDSTCVKMTALNMMFHGCIGEVACGDGLFLDRDWRYCLAVNPVLKHHGIPTIMKIEKDCSFIWRKWSEWENSWKAQKESSDSVVYTKKRHRKHENAPDLEKTLEDQKITQRHRVASQLNIFDV